MGKIVSRFVRREVQRFNVENRAHRVLDQAKPTPAPKYETNLQDMQRALEVDPNLLETLNKKNSGLDQRLKQVYVTSTNIEDSQINFRRDDPNRPLPLDRYTPEDFEFGFKEPQKVPAGRFTLRQALQFITAHQSEPETWTKERIAADYKLKENLVGNILHYFKSFTVYIPDDKMKTKELSQAQMKQLKDHNAN